MNILEARRKYGLSAGWKYSSGKLHGAWDIPTPSGTPLHLDVAATVRDLNDGAPNNRPGHNPGSGAPSNWILLHIPYARGTASLLLNHFSPGLAVRKGQKLAAGALLGNTGNSGNSSGPHLHCAAFEGAWSGAERYRYLKDTGLIIWEPDKVLRGSSAAPAPAPGEPDEEEDGMGWLVARKKSSGEAWLLYGTAARYGVYTGDLLTQAEKQGIPALNLDDKTFNALMKDRKTHQG